MRSLRLLLVLLLLSCGDSGNNSTTPSITQELKELRSSHEDKWDGAPARACWPGNPTCNGNSGLFSGLLCHAGKAEACEHVSQLAVDEGLLRYPGADAQAEDSSSRDELLGHLLAISKSHDVLHAERVLHIVRNGKICDNASDTRCTMTPVMWGLMRVVWNHIGLKPSWQMLASNVGDDSTLLVQAETAPEGFQLHLIGVILLIREHTGTTSFKTKLTADTLARRQPDNEFFVYLTGNRSKAAELLLKHAPSQPLPPEKQKQWYTERATKEAAWKTASSAVVYFLSQLLLSDNK